MNPRRSVVILRNVIATGAIALVAVTPAMAHHKNDYPPQRALANVYPDLVASTKNDPQGFTWKRFELRAHSRWDKTHPILVKKHKRLAFHAKLDYLDANPSPANNRRLAQLMYPDKFWALDAIFSGESGWHHDVWNGGARGAWPDRTNPGGGCSIGDAYGLGQACERYKMEAFWRSLGHPNPAKVYDSPRMQIVWAVEGYAPAVHGSIENAARQWTAGGRNGRTW